MHHIYTTRSFVIHSSPYGEAGKFILLFTEDFGMIGAVAQGVRLTQSKLKYHLQDFDYSNISLVKGKEVWRVTGAHELSHSKNTIVHLKVLKLLKRLLHGEEKNKKLFDIVYQLYNTEIIEENYETVECLTILRILHTLGYINDKSLEVFLSDVVVDGEIIEKAKIAKHKIIHTINQALNSSML